MSGVSNKKLTVLWVSVFYIKPTHPTAVGREIEMEIGAGKSVIFFRGLGVKFFIFRDKLLSRLGFREGR